MAVMEEIKERLREAFKETSFQLEDRVDKEFDRLEMGNMTHAQFDAEWDRKMDDLEEAGIVYAPSHLKRRYLSKITHNLRQAILEKT